MSRYRIAINGCGRIGRLILRALLHKDKTELVAVNDLTDNKVLAHLIKYDSAHGKFPGNVEADEENLMVNGNSIHAFAEPDPEKLPWEELNIDLVLECTGFFRDREQASKHLNAGADKVIISAPAKGEVKTIVLGVNDHMISKEDKILSNASCTTNCLAPMVKVLNDSFGISKGFATTTHAYTADQRLQDTPHKSDLRRARAAAINIVPTSTNAGTALSLVLPEMEGKIKASAVRVPVIDGSMTELTCILNKSVTLDEINAVFRIASDNGLNGVLEYTADPIVSSDIIGNPHSCIYDSLLTQVAGEHVRIIGWYDNEFGYASRLSDLVEHVQSL